jgi:hypothetical protein
MCGWLGRAQVPPYYPMVDGFDPQLSLSDRDMQDLQRWGFNALRVHTFIAFHGATTCRRLIVRVRWVCAVGACGGCVV